SPSGTRQAAADATGRLRGDLRSDGRSACDDPTARSAAARVPAAARAGDRRENAPACQATAGIEPDARDTWVPARAAVAGDLRDAGARDHPGRAHGRRADG